LQEKHRLKRRNEFKRVFSRGQSVANRQFVLYTYQRQTAEPFRLGVSISRRVGNAVVRNRLKRMIKEVTRHWAEHLKPQLDLVIIARKPSAELDYYQIKQSLRHLFNKSKSFQHLPPQND
jgi:ribonuclease P protein component